MEDAHIVIDRIYNYLDKFGLKTNTKTLEEFIAYVEGQWAIADDRKYSIYNASIIIGRMTNEYISLREFDKMMFWLGEGDKHINKDRNPEYVHNYYKGQCCLECENEEEALHYLNLCYAVEPDYIFTRVPFCYEFFNKHLESPRELPVNEDYDDDDEMEVECEFTLPLWAAFFKTENNIRCKVLLDYLEEEIDEEEAESLMDCIVTNIKVNEQVILDELLTKLAIKYKEWQPRFDYNEEDKAFFMPDIADLAQFGMLITPLVIYIIPESLGDTPNVGYLFSCSWDSEHALGFMTLNDQVISIGGADNAFCL